MMMNPLNPKTMEQKNPYDIDLKTQKFYREKTDLEKTVVDENGVMSASSILDDTPSDSGIQLLSSLASSMLSSTGLDYDAVEKAALAEPSQPQLVGEPNNNNNNDERVDDPDEKIPEELMTSITSTFDTENTEIVYRRKIKKPNSRQAPKKRVSFHEDILKNTKTDNIHIEHGFITYKQSKCGGAGGVPHHKNGRYSWCSEFDQENYASNDGDHGFDNDDEPGANKLYRNACSDVLDYGQYDVASNVSDGIKSNAAASNVLEYGKGRRAGQKDGDFYKCNCSSSNSSLDSSDSSSGAASDENSNKAVENVDPGAANKRNYQQAKSNSCDCIGENNNNNNISSSCYFSEPNIKHLNDDDKRNDNTKQHPKSVWSKEKKPKSSCLKKTKRNSTQVIPEYDLNTTVKKFNVHQLADVNNLIVDNSKMIIGSLKDIFGMSIPERGVPEGSEDQTVAECCAPEDDDEEEPTEDGDGKDNFTIINKPRPFLSKSLDGGFNKNNEASTKKNKYIHNVDEQLRRTNEEDLYAKTPHPSRQNSVREIDAPAKVETQQPKPEPAVADSQTNTSQKYRNKFIINCESIVFEHTGVSYFYEKANEFKQAPPLLPLYSEQFPGVDSSASSSSERTPFSRKLSNIFKTFTADKSVSIPKPAQPLADEKRVAPVGKSDSKESNLNEAAATTLMESSMTSSCSDKNSIFSDMTAGTTTDTATTSNSAATTTSATTSSKTQDLDKRLDYLAKIYGGKVTELSPKRQHLSSPLRKAGGQTTPSSSGKKPLRGRMSPDLFAGGLFDSATSKTGGTSSLLSEEFDDILTITTTESNNDMVIVDYPDKVDVQQQQQQYQYLRPPSSAMTTSQTSKTSLINRFLRTVTQKKMFEANIKKNTTQFVQTKLTNDRKLFENLYVKPPPVSKPYQKQLISDLNAEIAMEIEMALPASANSSPLHAVVKQPMAKDDQPVELADRFEGGLGEVSVELFNVEALHILRNKSEVLMKAFKLYTGYDREGHMTPVLVLLTDKTLYVADLVRNRLCNKFVLPYVELDVILMGLFGNTVLLSNSARDMQQVLLAGGPYPANGLVASLELCARRGGSQLPAVGHLTLDHLAPLQAFVRDNSSVDKEDSWKYYSVVNVPSGTLGAMEQEPLGPNLKGPLMHRNLVGTNGWSAGYFLLKAGVLYLFSDSTQKIPTWAVTLAECQGARRSTGNVGRPHCFELLLRTGSLQLAAPDEYAASEWLQALVQAASGLFEMQEKHKTLGCSLIMTSNHLITLREDFSSPLRRVNQSNQNSLMLSPPKGSLLLQQQPAAPQSQQPAQKENVDPNVVLAPKASISSNLDTSSEISSIRSSASTPTRIYDRRSNIASPTKLLSGSGGQPKSISYTSQLLLDDKSHTNMTSFYGKNSGLEILTCATIEEMVNVKIASDENQWWCVLEFSCQEVCESSDDLVVFFSTKSEQTRFLTMLEMLWNDKTHAEFPLTTITANDDTVGEHCENLFIDINRSWEPLMTAALGYPQ